MRKGAEAKVTKTLLESRTEKTAMERLDTLVRENLTQEGGRYSQDVGDELVEEYVAELLSSVVEEGEDTGGLQESRSATGRARTVRYSTLTPWLLNRTDCSPAAIRAPAIATSCCL